ncbi:MAG: hypothetical protein QM495_06850 [Lutibacter sp.]
MPKLLKKKSAISTRKIKKILVISDDYLEKELIQKYILEELKVTKSDIEWLFFNKKLKKEQVFEGIFTPKDLGWYGKITSEKLKYQLTKKYDLLINYSKIDNIYTNVLLLYCKVGFKAGFSHLDNRLYDLLINCKPDDLSLFTRELKKYLTILKKI